ncbi:1332_t:CDS:2, partial [Dentiscutata erythropus]
SITSSDSTSTSSFFNTSYNNSQTQPNTSSFNNNAISNSQTIKIYIIEDVTIESDHNIILLEFSILLTISSSYKQSPRKVSLWKQASSDKSKNTKYI